MAGAALIAVPLVLSALCTLLLVVSLVTGTTPALTPMLALAIVGVYIAGPFTALGAALLLAALIVLLAKRRSKGTLELS